MADSSSAPTDREHQLARLSSESFDVLVIGGGITGAGVARDAAMRGLRVALVEQDDFASGTSSRSSRLVHGGLRYLEHGQLGLVFESSRERRTLLRIAPHLVRPLSFVWPLYHRARVPGWKLRLGLTLYDALSLFRNVERHQRLDAHGVQSHEPRLSQTGLRGGARYWDAATNDARLTLATVLSARQSGAVVANHARVEGLRRIGGRIAGATVVNIETGSSIDIDARLVVNATGAWSDRVERLANPTAAAAVRGSKGSHVMVPRSRVGNASALTLVAPQDGRVMFVLPAGAFTIIGTTDTYDQVAPEDVRASHADIQYLLRTANHFFHDAHLTESDIVSAWAGLRPLASTGKDGNGPGGASREHAIVETAPGLLRITGGKLTTYRAMAEEVVNHAERILGVRHRGSGTATTPLGGGEIGDVRRAMDDATSTIGDGVVAERLVHAFGSEWRDVWNLTGSDPTLVQRIAPDRPYVLAELRYGVVHEMARTLADLLIRRTPIAFETPDHGREAARHVAPRVAEWLEWSAAETEAALAAYDSDVARMFTID